MEAPETVAEAVRLLVGRGYREDLRVEAEGVRCASCGEVHSSNAWVITEVFRFEGPSDPADEAIVLGVTCPRCGDRGIVVSAFGPDADDQLRELARVAVRRLAG
jgi:hypothetical protein